MIIAELSIIIAELSMIIAELSLIIAELLIDYYFPTQILSVKVTLHKGCQSHSL